MFLNMRLGRLAAIRGKRPPIPGLPARRRAIKGFNVKCIAESTGKVGVGILTFRSLAEAQKAVAAVLAYARPNYSVLLFDNSEDAETEKWATTQTAFTYIHSPFNVGCANARNRMAEYFASAGCAHFIAQDQDVVWAGDAAAAMLDVFEQYPGTGCVTWRLATDTMGRHTYDATGKVSPPESPGMCCAFPVAALADGTIRRGKGIGQHDPDLIGWYPGYGLCYRFDTDVCFSLWSKGYDTRVVQKGQCLVRHEHPHRGVSRLGPALDTERAFSDQVLRVRTAKYGWPTL